MSVDSAQGVMNSVVEEFLSFRFLTILCSDREVQTDLFVKLENNTMTFNFY